MLSVKTLENVWYLNIFESPDSPVWDSNIIIGFHNNFVICVDMPTKNRTTNYLVRVFDYLKLSDYEKVQVINAIKAYDK